MDLIDNPAESILTAVFEIPGMKTSDISLHILEGHLVVLGERRPPYNITQQSEGSSQDTEGNGTQRLTTIPIQELRFGAFRRAVLVPEGLKVSLPLLRTCQASSTDSTLYRNQRLRLASTKVC